ncbi:hypothetical protein LAZ67_9002916 [Cordylochernes scorpioides]|uniref:Peptidase A2 domain-containing protein n=1 Tax=Cordylochernes scorpioides TaxID=51811 RepID=A0ABY6KZ43_9ARAC|nr:hypothetical protein LAZ67_9002916 [Cordylochernes scorpioides]
MGKFGKLQPAVSGATHSAAGQNIRRNSRLFVSDKKTGMRFLVDSGADVSLIPYKGKIGTTLNDFKLYAANGTEISTYGTQILSLDLGLRRRFQWPFVIAKTNRGILGADFLNTFKLILDINRRQLIDGITNLTIKDITRPNVGIMKANHDVKHFIITKGPPVFSRARPLDPKRLNEAKQEFQFMLEHGIIRPSKSQWASPLHLVTKKDGTLRPCGDYRKLNSQTLPDRYPIPRLEDFQHILSGKMIFSRLDLFKAYYQIPIAEENKPKTAIITPFGLYEFNVMSFGLRNAPATWYSGVNPGGALNIRNRQHQTTLTRFRTGHLKPLKIENNNKIYPTCPKCSLAPAAPEHILACIRCTKQDLWERPLLIIKQLEEHDLMEFV